VVFLASRPAVPAAHHRQVSPATAGVALYALEAAAFEQSDGLAASHVFPALLVIDQRVRDRNPVASNKYFIFAVKDSGERRVLPCEEKKLKAHDNV
jgi:hypothetical protein